MVVEVVAVIVGAGRGETAGGGGSDEQAASSTGTTGRVQRRFIAARMPEPRSSLPTSPTAPLPRAPSGRDAAPDGESIVLGIDLGGTKIEGAVVAFDPAGSVSRELARSRIATDRDEGYEAVLMRVAGLVHQLVADAGLDALPPVGVGMPGSVTRATGLVKNSNTVCLNGRPFRQDLETALGVPVRFANDANCLALAEARLGAGRGHEGGVVFGVILGTGVGGGWVLHGRPWDGPQGIGGEWGHHALVWPDGRPCYCGKRGCVERYLAGPDVERAYAQRAGGRLPLAQIAARAADPAIDDAAARQTIDELLTHFGRALANVISIVDPDLIVLGGGVSQVAALYTEGRARVAREVFNDELLTPIVPARLGPAAGVLGAALLVL